MIRPSWKTAWIYKRIVWVYGRWKNKTSLKCFLSLFVMIVLATVIIVYISMTLSIYKNWRRSFFHFKLSEFSPTEKIPRIDKISELISHNYPWIIINCSFIIFLVRPSLPPTNNLIYINIYIYVKALLNWYLTIFFSNKRICFKIKDLNDKKFFMRQFFLDYQSIN